MRARRMFVLGALAAVGVASSPCRRAVARAWPRVVSRTHDIGGRLQGVGYRLQGRHPRTDVPPTVLADRVRSVLGPLEKRRDLPHVHVMVDGRTVLLHGDVPTTTDAVALEVAARRVAGVDDVRSHLHVGLLASDERPSAGRSRVQASAALRRLLDAAVGAGVHVDAATAVVRTTVSALLARVPEGERAHVLAHLPADVAAMADASRWYRMPLDDPAVAAVLRTLAALVPEERADVAAVLPADLRRVWDVAAGA